MFRQSERENQQDDIAERRKDPVFRQSEREKLQEKRKDPEFRQSERKNQRDGIAERRKDPEFRQSEQKKQQAYWKNKMKCFQRRDATTKQCNETTKDRENKKKPKLIHN